MCSNLACNQHKCICTGTLSYGKYRQGFIGMKYWSTLLACDSLTDSVQVLGQCGVTTTDKDFQSILNGYSTLKKLYMDASAMLLYNT